MASLHKLVFSDTWLYAGPRVAANSCGWGYQSTRSARVVAPYAAPAFSRMVMTYSLSFQARHYLAYGDMRKVALRFNNPYEDLPIVRAKLVEHYGNLATIASRLLSPYGDVGKVAVSFSDGYGLVPMLSKRMVSTYDLKFNVAAKNSAHYDLKTYTSVSVNNISAWALTSASAAYAVDNNPVVSIGGELVEVDDVTLSCDEGSSLWIASFKVLEVADFSRIKVPMEVSLAVSLPSGVETFQLLVDSKQLTRSFGDINCTVTARSLIGLKGAPYSESIQYVNQSAESAKGLVESFIGAVDWQIPDWYIPPAVAAFTGMSPLEAAQRIAESAGAVIESLPSSSIVVRLKYPVDVPDYATTTADYDFFDSEVHDVSSSYGYSSLFNRLSVGNDSEATYSSDRLEEVEEPSSMSDTTKRRVRAYLTTNRPVVLVHTGHINTLIEPLGEQVRQESELVEFVDGVSSTRYPIDSVLPTSEWKYVNLGSVVYTGTKLVAATGGCSMYSIKYNVRSLEWKVSLANDETVQFKLLDA